MKRIIGRLAVVLVALSATGAIAQGKVNLSIGTGGTGGVYYPLGGGIANALTKYVPGVTATAEVTGGSVDNLKLIGAGNSEIGLAQSDAVWDAYQGTEKFKDAKVPVRALMMMYPGSMHVVTVESTGIRKMSDLKGKRVSTGAAGSATEVMGLRMIELSGLDKDKDMRRERLSVSESVNALKDGKIDAFFWNGGIPTAAVTDLAATPGVKMHLVDQSELVDPLNKKYGPLYVKGVIPPKTYPGQDAPNQIATAWTILIVHEKMSEQLAYSIVKTVFEHKPELVAVHKEAMNFELKSQSKAASPIPYHPGAAKYFAEKGIDVK